MGVISIVNGDYKATNITGGAPPCTGVSINGGTPIAGWFIRENPCIN